MRSFFAVLFAIFIIGLSYLAGTISRAEHNPTIHEVCQQYVCSDTGK